MNSGNLTKSSKKIFSISSIVLTIVALAFVFPIAYADHGSTFRIELIEPGSESISYRDSSNGLPQSHTLSVDTSTVQSGFFTVNLEEADANLASVPSFSSDGVNVVPVSASSTTSDTVLMEFLLEETDVNSGEFTGILPFSTTGNNVDSLLMSAGDDISVFYEPEFDSVGRFTATYSGVMGTTGVSIGENWVEDPITGEILYECTEVANTLPFDLITYPIEIKGGLNPGTAITVIMSYANAWDGWDSIYTTNQLIIVYRNSECAAFESLGGVVDTNALTVTSVLQPSGGSQQGQFAIGVDVGGIIGGGGGGLVRPGFVVNALAGANVISSFFGNGGGGYLGGVGSGAGPSQPTVTSGVVNTLSDESIGFLQQGVTSDSDSTSNSLASTQNVGIGKDLTFKYSVYENRGPERIIHATMYFFDAEMMNVNDRINVANSETYIRFDKGQPVKVVDPFGYFEKANFELSAIDTYNAALKYDITFGKIMPESHILLRTWDAEKHSSDTLYENAIVVSENSIADNEPFLDTQNENQLTDEETVTKTGFPGIPLWVKNNAMWWHEKQIGDEDFVAGIQYMINEEIITIPETEIASSTTEEIPQWISNVAGYWSNDQISEGEFVQAMQWLVSNGVMQV